MLNINNASPLQKIRLQILRLHAPFHREASISVMTGKKPHRDAIFLKWKINFAVFWYNKIIKNMKKIVIIFIILIFILGIAFYFLFLRTSSPTPPPSQVNGFPITPPSPPPILPNPDQKTFIIETPAGGIEVNNFIKDAQPQANDIFLLKETGLYAIYYDARFSSFSIILLAEPLISARQEAEIGILDIVRIDSGALCKLDISLTVPAAVNPNIAGKEYGISFCPGGIPF